MSTGRAAIAATLVSDLVGPANGEEEVLDRRPSEVYIAGAVYPVGFRGSDNQPDDQSDPMQQSTKFFPSAIGLTVLAPRSAVLDFTASFASYVESSGGMWKRSGHVVELRVDLSDRVETEEDCRIAEGAVHAELTVTRRDIGSPNLVLVTAMLVNRHLAEGTRGDRHILFQAGISVCASKAMEQISNGEDLGIPGDDPIHLGDEEEDLSFLYRDSEPIAHGHGVSVNWSEDRHRVWTVVVPHALVHSLRADPPNLSGLDLGIPRLVGANRHETIKRLIDRYAAWTDELSIRVSGAKVDSRHQRAIQRLINRNQDCLQRLRAGLETLQKDSRLAEAWDLALASMEAQFQRPSIRPRGVPEEPRLRPFQVAYALLVLPGLGSEGAENPSRDIVDLLWFPTGGGKTEAYLFVVLIEAFSRRLTNPNDTGCVALSRYTYRMLAFDQFARAAAAICAAELVRGRSLMRLGSTPFSVGLWIGSSQTPNRVRDIDTAYRDQPHWRDRWLSGQPSFPIVECPWCGTSLKFTSDYLYADPDNAGFIIRCPNARSCPFADHDRSGLPISVVDEHIYRTLPTLVVATTDKLAQLPVWSDEEGPALLRGRGAAGPVSILVFDELHLLSGPLGTLASLYEIAVDAIVSGKSSGRVRPKILASTATIRTAGEQAKGLLGRELATFPPSGDSPDDSFWAVRDDREETARLYIGAMTSGSTWQALYVYAQTSIFRSVAKLPEDQRNPYWTSVVYAGTLRDHGRAVGLIANDVRSRISQLDVAGGREIRLIEELRGDRVGSRLPQILAMLKRDYSSAGNEALDAVVTTNLIQVGVDVSRLGLMVMLGQPKGTAEYIQASSRVGRTIDSAGLVVTLFQHTRPRDRSHYELFRSYHSALYRSVEPISVTPLAAPALERSIRAVFAATARHSGLESSNADAKEIGLNRVWLEEVARRVAAAASARDDGMYSHSILDTLLSRLVEGWHERATASKALLWSDRAGSLPHVPMLLAPRLAVKGSAEWPFDYSLRNVEGSVSVPIGLHRDRVEEGGHGA